MTQEKLISCFVVSPIRFKGETIVDQDVELTAKQVKGFQKLKPCPVRVRKPVDVDVVAPASTEKQDIDEPEAPAKAENLDGTVEPPTVDESETPAKAEAKARAKK